MNSGTRGPAYGPASADSTARARRLARARGPPRDRSHGRAEAQGRRPDFAATARGDLRPGLRASRVPRIPLAVSATDAISDTARLEQRITELEVKVAFQERTIDDLDAVLRHFTARVEALERELSRVRGELEAPSPSTAEVLAALDDEPA